MFLQKCLSKQHVSFTAEYIYRLKKSKHCQLWHISRLYDLKGLSEVLLSDIIQTKSDCRQGDHHPLSGILNVTQEKGESEPHIPPEGSGERNTHRRVNNFLYWSVGWRIENRDLICR